MEQSCCRSHRVWLVLGAGLPLATSGLLEVKYPSFSHSETFFGFPKSTIYTTLLPLESQTFSHVQIGYCGHVILCLRSLVGPKGSNAEYHLKRQKRLFCFSVSNSPFRGRVFGRLKVLFPLLSPSEPKQSSSPSTTSTTMPGHFLISSGAAALSQTDKGGEALPSLLHCRHGFSFPPCTLARSLFISLDCGSVPEELLAMLQPVCHAV